MELPLLLRSASLAKAAMILAKQSHPSTLKQELRCGYHDEAPGGHELGHQPLTIHAESKAHRGAWPGYTTATSDQQNRLQAVRTCICSPISSWLLLIEMASNLQTVENKGIYRALPTYPPSIHSLTALITGTNGISGYHMVKVLSSAPQRWKKIYCLSRRPPPEYFFSNLGEGASRVEHITADFLTDGETIAKHLKGKVEEVDHVFFSSYMPQPNEKGGVSRMWSDADALVDVNVKLLKNFLDGLKVANLVPKRFMLQTGAKHYGFHIGPATNPSFESDPRVKLESNFYYNQEDLLAEYCEETGAAWNVVRPSYIIGAVRDNSLNFWPGIAIYAAVQKELRKSLEFPGDFAAWDKEQCR